MDENENIKLNIKRGEPFTMAWRNIFYEVEIKKNEKIMKKTLINKVSGYVTSGTITAIMGPSGCGKTSLLNFLNDRINFHPSSTHSGEIFINSQIKTSQEVSEYSSYVMQDDILLDVLTPEETLRLTARLRAKKTKQEYDLQVKDLLEDLKLTKCKDVRIGGGDKKGISGGERKRTAIGIEIISDPSILFLDEPTSGLDSQTSLVLIEFLKELAIKKNKIILLSIHQPSSNIFGDFDKLIILNKGRDCYQGSPNNVFQYFKSINMDLGIKTNPADAFMHKMEEQNARIDRGESNEASVMDIYKEREAKTTEDFVTEIIKKNQPCELKAKKFQGTGFCNELSILCERSWVNFVRNPNLLKIKIAMVIIFSFIACSIFYDMKNDMTGVFNKSGFMFFFTVNNFMTIIFASVVAFPKERNNFIREYSGKMYGVLPYYLSKNIIETPITLLSTILFAAIVYFIVGLRHGAQFYFTFICIFACLAFHAQSMGLCFGAAFRTLDLAMIITNFSVLPIFLFSGFLINQENMPVWLAWIRFFSPFRYSIEAALRNEFDDNPDIPPEFNQVKNLNLDIGMWNCVIILIAWGVFLRTLGFIFLKMLVKKVG